MPATQSRPTASFRKTTSDVASLGWRSAVATTAAQSSSNSASANASGAVQTPSRLSTLEQQLFDRQFEHEVVNDRLVRLEKTVFGEVHPGEVRVAQGHEERDPAAQ